MRKDLCPAVQQQPLFKIYNKFKISYNQLACNVDIGFRATHKYMHSAFN